LFGVEAIRFAVHPAGYPIGPVHLDHVFTLAGQFASECGAE
jgi:hypothetical protein